MSQKFDSKPRFAIDSHNIGTPTIELKLNIAAAEQLAEIFEDIEFDESEKCTATLHVAMKRHIKSQKELEISLKRDYLARQGQSRE